MTGPEVFANTLANIQQLDGLLCEASNIWRAHQRCGHNQCGDSRKAIAAIDEGLDRRLELMRIRDLELAWFESGGTKELTRE